MLVCTTKYNLISYIFINNIKFLCFNIFVLEVLLPHIGSASIETRTEMAITTAKNIIAVLDNTPMPNEVQF